MACRQGIVGAQLGGQKGQAPKLGSMGSETTRKKVGESARVNTLVPIFDMSLSLAALRGVSLPPESVTPVDLIANLSIDQHRAAYTVKEQNIGNPLEGIVIYPANMKKSLARRS